MKNLIDHKRHFHFIGIGGIGMSAIARILAKKGHSISGSDHKSSKQLDSLSREGIKVFTSQETRNIEIICKETNKVPLIIISSAIPTSNKELIAAHTAKLEIKHRSDLLACLIKNQKSIAVAGSHGKTTTSTIITTLLALRNQDPTAIIGGVIPHYQSNGHSGKGKLLVAEADESDGTIVKFEPDIGVITNLELDHYDHYKNIDSLIQTIRRFGKNCKAIIANRDCKILRKSIDASYWWSIETKENINFAGIPKKIDGAKTIADFYENDVLIEEINVPMPGLHNLSNVIGAIAACRIAGLTFEEIKECIPQLKAPKRRFDFRGNWKGRQIVDDYAHHPTEIKATISLSQLLIKTNSETLKIKPKRVFVVFQPHRYSRTKKFLEDFAIALQGADSILLAPVYSAGEAKIEGGTSHCLAKCIKEKNSKIPISVAESIDQVPNLIEHLSEKEDLVLAIGAGDINGLWEKLNKKSNLSRNIN